MVDKSMLKIPEATPQDLTRFPVKLPKIETDHAKCTVPFWCKKCLQSCPQLVFPGLLQAGPEIKGERPSGAGHL